MTTAAALTAAQAVAATAAAMTGLWVAWLWYRAKNVTARPDFGPDKFAPVDPMLGQMMWTGAILEAATASGALNAQTARWTAAAVVLAAVQSFADFLTSAFA